MQIDKLNGRDGYEKTTEFVGEFIGVTGHLLCVRSDLDRKIGRTSYALFDYAPTSDDGFYSPTIIWFKTLSEVFQQIHNNGAREGKCVSMDDMELYIHELRRLVTRR